MLAVLNVEVCIVKGLGPDTFNKVFEVAFHDIEPGTSDYDIKQMAQKEVETKLYKSEDYPLYGKNWEVVGIYYA